MSWFTRNAKRADIAIAVAPTQAKTQVERRWTMKILDGVVDLFRKPVVVGNKAFEPAVPPPGVLPAGRKLAMDSHFGDLLGWAYAGIGGRDETHLSYQELSVLAQQAEYRNGVETFAAEMVRKWIKFTYTGNDVADEDENPEDDENELDSDNDGEIDALEPKDEADGAEAAKEGSGDPYAEKDEADKADAPVAGKPKAQPPKAKADAPPKAKGAADDIQDLLRGSPSSEPQAADPQAPPNGQSDPENPLASLMGGQMQPPGPTPEEKAAKRAKLQAKQKAKAKTTAKLRAIEDEFTRLGVRDAFRKATEHDGFFGRAHIYIDIDNAWNYPDELQTGIGTGDDAASLNKVQQGLLTRIKVIEPVWCYPSRYNSNDPLREDWYVPHEWYIMGKRVEATRLLTFVGREVPDILKPAYSFGGLSLIQLAKSSVDNFRRTRQSVSDIIHSFSVFVLKTNMDNVLRGGSGNDLFKRLTTFTEMRDNTGVMALDKESEDFGNVSAPLGGLDHLQAQSQEQLAAVWKIPLVKLTGISPSGLNASSDGEMRCFNDEVHSKQEAFYRTNLTKTLNFVQLHLFGEIDPEIGFEFEPLYELTEKEMAEVREIEVRTAVQLIDAGVLAPEEERQRIADDPNSPYQGLDPAELPDLAQEESEGLVPGGGKGGPGGAGGGPPGAGNLNSNKDNDTDNSGFAPEPKTPDPSAPDSGSGADDAKPSAFTFACDDFDPGEHPRGQPNNAGEFAKSGSGGAGVAPKPSANKRDTLSVASPKQKHDYLKVATPKAAAPQAAPKDVTLPRNIPNDILNNYRDTSGKSKVIHVGDLSNLSPNPPDITNAIAQLKTIGDVSKEKKKRIWSMVRAATADKKALKAALAHSAAWTVAKSTEVAHSTVENKWIDPLVEGACAAALLYFGIESPLIEGVAVAVGSWMVEQLIEHHVGEEKAAECAVDACKYVLGTFTHYPSVPSRMPDDPMGVAADAAPFYIGLVKLIHVLQDTPLKTLRSAGKDFDIKQLLGDDDDAPAS